MDIIVEGDIFFTLDAFAVCINIAEEFNNYLSDREGRRRNGPRSARRLRKQNVIGIDLDIAEGAWRGRTQAQFNLSLAEGVDACFERMIVCARKYKLVQIWISAGVGITPFVARMEWLAASKQRTQTIHLFHSTAQISELAEQKIRAVAVAANVTLHLTVSPPEPKLSTDKICSTVPEWQAASYWFCGPSGFGRSLKAEFVAKGVDDRNFHQERFEMR